MRNPRLVAPTIARNSAPLPGRGTPCSALGDRRSRCTEPSRWWCRSTPAASLSGHPTSRTRSRRKDSPQPLAANPGQSVVLTSPDAERPLAASLPRTTVRAACHVRWGADPRRRHVSRRCRAHNRTKPRHSVGSTPRSTTGHRCRRDHRERTRPSPCQARPSSRIARSAAVPPLLPPGIYADAGEKFKGEALELRRPSPRTHSAAGGARGSLRAGAAHHNRPVTLSDFGHRAEGEDTSPPREETATADDDLVGVVDVALVADVIKPAEVCAVARKHAVARGGREESAECRVCPVAPPVPATLLHGREEY